MIVVDLGSETYGSEESFSRLFEMFKPDEMYCFDPLGRNTTWGYRGCKVHFIAAAAWNRNGTTKLGIGADSGLNATVVREKQDCGEWNETIIVPCLDFSEWISDFVAPVVVKMDIEGAEYQLLEAMIEDRTDSLMVPLLIEWHDHKLGDSVQYTQRREAILAGLRCEVRGW